MSCLNSLNNPVVFIPTAALIVLVLLVWVSFRPGAKDSEPNINFTLSNIWTYVAILFALVATAIFIFTNTCSWAKFFLILSFLMTLLNIFIWFVTALIYAFITGGKQLTSVTQQSCWRQKWPWTAFWLIALDGLTILSLSAIGVCKVCCIGFGIALLVVLIISGICVHKGIKMCCLMSIIKFIKKYWLWILIVLALVALIGLLLIIFLKECCWYIFGAAAMLAADGGYGIWLWRKERRSQSDENKTLKKPKSPELKAIEEMRSDINRLMIIRRISNRILRR